MIDTHCHILPEVDDGAESWEDSLEMARAAVSEGITTIIATPHHHNGRHVNNCNNVHGLVDAINVRLEDADIPLIVLPGQEVRSYSRIIEDYESGDTIGLNHSRYMLVEFPSDRVPSSYEDIFHELQLAGVIPIIAHPERNAELANNSDRLGELIELGALAQVTAHSINGGFGPKVQRIALDMCCRNLVQIVASDAHGIRKRPFGLREAYTHLESNIGMDAVEEMKNRAEAIVRNETIVRRPIISLPQKKRKFWLW